MKQKHDVHRPGINTNYLRPLTPQIFPTSTSAHNFDAMRRREENAERARLRPSSAIEISSDGTERLERYHDLLSYRAASPTRHSVSTASSDRSRREMQLSLHQLLVETGNGPDDIRNNEQESDINESSYHKQFLATKERIMRRGSGKETTSAKDLSTVPQKRHSYSSKRGHASNTDEDYGIYGDYDDDNVVSYSIEKEEKVKPMQLLNDSHRPKIMVPKWRQNAPLQPPNYNSSVEILQRQNGCSSEENLAASLAQSLMDDTATIGEKHLENRNFSSHTLPRKHVKTSDQTGRKSPRTLQSAKMSIHANADPKALQTDSSVQQKVMQDSTVQGDTSGKQSVAKRDKARRGSGVSTALNDVIAYTADCLDRSDSNRLTSENSDSNESQESKLTASQSAIEDHTTSSQGSAESANNSLNVPNVPSSSVSETHVNESLPVPVKSSLNSLDKHENMFSNISPTSNMDNGTPVNTDKLVYYFQNRSSGMHTEEEANEVNDSCKTENNDHMNGTSTPVSEAKPFFPEMYSAKTNVGRKDRLVRADASTNEESKSSNPNTVKDTNDKTDESVNKEKVLRAVDRLRMSFERPKTLDLSNNQNEAKQTTRPASADSSPQKAPLILRTFALPQKEIPRDNNRMMGYSVQSGSKQTTDNQPYLPDQSENSHRMYKKASGLKSPTKHLAEATATARQIQKLERSTSPTGRNVVTDNTSNKQTERQNRPLPAYRNSLPEKSKRGTSPQRLSKDGSFIPQRSGSPVRSISRPISAEAAIDPLFMQNGENTELPLKSAMKDTKIPIMRKSGASSGTNQLSKSTEDISKMKKKSAFKDSLKNIFGRKK